MRNPSIVVPKGFSILESLVVILVIILLASIVVPGLLGRTGAKVPLPKPLQAEEVDDVEERPAPDGSRDEADADLRPSAPIAGDQSDR